MKTQVKKGNSSYTSDVASINTAYYATDIELVNRIKNGDSASLDKFYSKHRAEFFQWSYKYFGLTADQALDIYQDTFVILYENVKKGKLQFLQSSLKTYMFAISKNLILHQFSKEKKFKEKWEDLKEESDIEDKSFDDQSSIHEALIKCLDKMAIPSQNLLKAYYYEKLPMRTIAEKLGYKNEHVAKNMKLRCMKMLKKALLEAIKDN